MLNLCEIREKLKDRRPSVVSEATGVHVNTVISIQKGRSVNPTYRVIVALSNYLEADRCK